MSDPVALELQVVSAIGDRLEDTAAWRAMLTARGADAAAWLAAHGGRAPYRTVIAALAAPEAAPRRLPAAVVVPLADEARENLVPGGGALQRRLARIGVITMLAAPNDPSGAAKRAALETLLGGTRALLSGWTPPGAAEALHYERGALAALDGARAAWRDEYRLTWWAAEGGVARAAQAGGAP